MKYSNRINALCNNNKQVDYRMPNKCGENDSEDVMQIHVDDSLQFVT